MAISREKAPLVIAASIIIIVVSLVSIMRTMSPGGPKVNMDRIEGLGQIAGEEAARFLGSGKTVVLVAYPEGPSKHLKLQQDALKDALEDGGVTVKAVESLQGNDEFSMGMIPMEMGGFPIEELIRIGEAHPDVDALVSMVGAPWLQADTAQSIPASLPQLIVAQGAMMIGAGDLFSSGLVSMAIMPRTDMPAEGAEEPKTTREWFDRYFEVVTADTAGSLPY